MSTGTPTAPKARGVSPATLETLRKTPTGRQTIAVFLDKYRTSRAAYIAVCKPMLDALEENARKARADYEETLRDADTAIEQFESALASTGNLVA